MEQNADKSIDIKFILITEETSFIPDNILNCCEIINVSRPAKSTYIKCIKTKLPTKLKLENIDRFLIYCEEDPKLISILKDKNEFLLTELLIEKRKGFSE
jgi:hypothetical protein